MRTHLLKSFIYVCSFWWITSFIFWIFSDNQEAFLLLKKLGSFLPYITLPEIQTDGSMETLAAMSLKFKVIFWWTLPCLAVCLISGCLGYLATWRKALTEEELRAQREAGQGEFRGLKVSMGQIPEPARLNFSAIDLEPAEGEEQNHDLGRITELEKRMLEDILGMLAANPEAYPGEGVTDSLPEYALTLVEKALKHRHFPGLCAIVAAGLELGKITSYEKDEAGQWQLIPGKQIEREASKIIGRFPSWWALPKNDRLSVYLAVKYRKIPKQMPVLAGDKKIVDVAWDLLNTSIQADTEAKEVEKKKVIEKHEGNIPDIIWDTFIRLLPTVSFHSRSAPVGVPKIGHKSGKRIYMVEIKLRELIQAKLPDELKALYPTGPWKTKGKVHPLSVEFMKVMDAKGYLVKSIGNDTVEPHEALWKLKAGEVEFKGVIAIDCDKELLQYCPNEDSSYQLEVTGALFKAKEDPSISMLKDAMADVLAPRKV